MIDKELFQLLGKDRKKIFFISLLLFLNLLFSVLITASFCSFFYLLIEKKDFSFLGLVLALILLFAIGKFVVNFIVDRIKIRLGLQLRSQLRKKVYQKLLRLNFSYQKHLSQSELTQLAVEGIEQLDLYYTTYLPQFFYAMIAPVVLFIICVFLEYRTALVLLVCLPLIPLSIVLVSKYAKKIFAKYWNQYTSMGDIFLDSINGMKELKIYQADEKKKEEIKEKSEAFRKITMKVLTMQLASVTIMDLVAFGAAGVAIVISLISMKSNHLSPFITLFLILISAEFFLPMRALGSAFHVAMNGTTAGHKLLSFLQVPEESKKELTLQKIEKIDFCNLSFHYLENKEVLKNITFEMQKGFYGLVGESGSGKSSIVSLLFHAYKPQEGHILINDIDLNTLNLEDYYRKIGLISYDHFLFHTSIRENFLWSNDQLSDEEMIAWLKKVNLEEKVKEIGGLDAIILEDSENLSGGERQRLALAICLSKEKDVYIFDEATSSIDIESEKIILDNIVSLSENKLVLLISHRLENVRNCKEIFVLQEGMLIEKGNHEFLLSGGGSYAKMYQKQQELENAYKEENER